ncbi:hypothetical protein OAN24_04760 [Pseudodesulfovibrio sp.]|nr:hypothetical protein [Pseudodesulfovibrio sp.]
MQLNWFGNGKASYHIIATGLLAWFATDMVWAIYQDAWTYFIDMATNTVASMVFYHCITKLKEPDSMKKPGSQESGFPIS